MLTNAFPDFEILSCCRPVPAEQPYINDGERSPPRHPRPNQAVPSPSLTPQLRGLLRAASRTGVRPPHPGAPNPQSWVEGTPSGSVASTTDQLLSALASLVLREGGGSEAAWTPGSRMTTAAAEGGDTPAGGRGAISRRAAATATAEWASIRSRLVQQQQQQDRSPPPFLAVAEWDGLDRGLHQPPEDYLYGGEHAAPRALGFSIDGVPLPGRRQVLEEGWQPSSYGGSRPGVVGGGRGGGLLAMVASSAAPDSATASVWSSLRRAAAAAAADPGGSSDQRLAVDTRNLPRFVMVQDLESPPEVEEGPLSSAVASGLGLAATSAAVAAANPLVVNDRNDAGLPLGSAGDGPATAYGDGSFLARLPARSGPSEATAILGPGGGSGGGRRSSVPGSGARGSDWQQQEEGMMDALVEEVLGQVGSGQGGRGTDELVPSLNRSGTHPILFIFSCPYVCAGAVP